MRKSPIISKARHSAAFLVFWTLLAHGQPEPFKAGDLSGTETSSATGSGHRESADNEPDVEEIKIYGQKTSLILKMLLQSERRVYDFFNEWNTEDEYDMVCKKEARIGSQIRYQVCKPRFVRLAEAEAAEDSVDTSFLDVNRANMRRLRQRQRELMAELANENPQFMEFLHERGELRNALQSARGADLGRPSWEVVPDRNTE